MSNLHFQEVNLADPSLLLSPPTLFKCEERIHSLYDDNDDDYEVSKGRVEFTCTIPNILHVSSNQGQSQYLNNDADNYEIKTVKFQCRDPSVGFLNSNESSVQDDGEDQVTMDPNFFDTGYTLAGKTGFQIWAGSRVMMEILLPWSYNNNNNSNNDCYRSQEQLVNCSETNELIQHYQTLVMNGAKILELGAGVGVVGVSLAAVGGQVLLTDLPSLVDHSLWPNILTNNSVEDNEENDQTRNNCIASSYWLGDQATKFHHGWTAATALDWTKPVDEQLSQEQIENIQIIISCDCVWLVSMLDSLLDSVSTVFERTKATSDIAFLMSFKRRDTEKQKDSHSSTFTTVNSIISSVKERGWKLRCLSWRPVIVKGDNDVTDEKEVYVFEIKPF